CMCACVCVPPHALACVCVCVRLCAPEGCNVFDYANTAPAALVGVCGDFKRAGNPCPALRPARTTQAALLCSALPAPITLHYTSSLIAILSLNAPLRCQWRYMDQ